MSADNLVMACGQCNRSKGSALPLRWLTRVSLWGGGGAPKLFGSFRDLPVRGQRLAFVVDVWSQKLLKSEDRRAAVR